MIATNAKGNGFATQKQFDAAVVDSKRALDRAFAEERARQSEDLRTQAKLLKVREKFAGDLNLPDPKVVADYQKAVRSAYGPLAPFTKPESKPKPKPDMPHLFADDLIVRVAPYDWAYTEHNGHSFAYTEDGMIQVGAEDNGPTASFAGVGIEYHCSSFSLDKRIAAVVQYEVKADTDDGKLPFNLSDCKATIESRIWVWDVAGRDWASQCNGLEPNYSRSGVSHGTEFGHVYIENDFMSFWAFPNTSYIIYVIQAVTAWATGGGYARIRADNRVNIIAVGGSRFQ